MALDTRLLYKYGKRILFISGHGVHQILVPFTNFLISLLVIRLSSESVWGEIVSYLLVLNIMFMIIHWGNTAFLLRNFKPSTQSISTLWQESITSRSLLTLACLIILSLIYRNDTLLGFLLIWLIGTYIYRSFDVLSLYTRKFKIPISIETISTLVMLGYVFYNHESMSSSLIIKYYAIISILKSIAYFFCFKKIVFKSVSWKFSWSFLAFAFPFFVPPFLSFLQSQIDLYTIAYLMLKDDLGRYEVFIKFYFYIIVAINIGIAPFIKSIYRLPKNSFIKLNNLVFKFGIIISIPFTILIYYILSYMFQLQYPIEMYALGYLMVIPFFGYIIKIHELLKYYQQKKLIYTSLIELLINLILNLSLIPIFGLTGAVIATVIVQWLTMILFSIYLRSARNNYERARS